MIKNLQASIIVLSIFFSFAMQAQDSLFVEFFDDNTLGQFNAISEIGDGEMWVVGSFDQKYYAQMNGYNDGIKENLDWLISTAIDMSMYDDEVLTFQNANNFSGPDLELLISVDYSGSGDPNAATWTDLTSLATWSPGNYDWVSSESIDLSLIEGTAYLAFKYNSSEALAGKLHRVDDIVISATTLSTDLEEDEIADKISEPYVSNEYLHFSVLDASLALSIEICTIDGQVVRSLGNSTISGDVSIPLVDLPTGIYVLVAKSEGSLKSFKFVK